MHSCGVNSDTLCPFSLISGQVLAAAYGIDRLFDYKACIGLISSESVSNVKFRIDLSRVYESLNISFMVGQSQGDCGYSVLLDRTKHMTIALGTVSGSEIVCYTYNYESFSAGSVRSKVSVFADSCKRIEARYIVVSGSNTDASFALAKMFVSEGDPRCPPGYICPDAKMSVPTICPNGSFCPGGSSSPIVCPAGTFAPGTGLSACLQCVTCQIDEYQNTPCTNTRNRSCIQCTTAKPLNSVYDTSSSACPWVCKNGYWGSECEPCLANHWCKFGMQNRCPLSSISLPLSDSQSDCVCGPGYMSTGKITGASLCVLCPEGVLCNGVPVLEVEISTTPLVNVATQVLLARKPLPPASNMVTLFESIPATIASIVATLPNASATIHLRQVCRQTYCVACEEGVSTCIRYITVGMQSVGGSYFTDSVTSLRRDTMYTFVGASASDCAPRITGLSAEFISDNDVMISSSAVVLAVRVACSTNAALFLDIPVDAV